MTSIPTLTIHFDPPDNSELISLQFFPSGGTKPITCSLALPFRLAQIPLVLRALDARQYPDYPDQERLIRPNDIREQIVTELQALELWEEDDMGGAVAEDVHIRVGRLLGAALLPCAAAKDCLSGLYRSAIKAGGGEIVLRFASGANALAALPWEVAHDGSSPLLLTRGVVLNCTRVIMPDHLSTAPYTPSNQLHVLTIAPRVQMNETDRAFEQLTRSRMGDELHNLPMADIEPLPQATMDALYNRLDKGPSIQVLDYFGHGISTDEGGALLLENAQGGRDPVPAHRLAALPNLPPLVVLNACQSARVNVDEPLTAMATALSDAGVRAVLAMQLTIRTEAVANVAAPTFYRKLAEHKSVQQAVAAVRQALYAIEPNGTSWYVPALYLRQSDQEPFVLLEQPAVHYPSNPFAGVGALGDPNLRTYRVAEENLLWERLNALSNLSIIGPGGSGKSTTLALIAAERGKWLKSKPDVISLPLQRNMKLSDAQLILARKLGGTKARGIDLLTLLRNKHLILLLDDLGQLDPGDRGLELRLWLRQLSQDRMQATVQLVAASKRPLDQIFAADESPDYSPLHDSMKDSIELGAFTVDETRQFIAKSLEATPIQLRDFSDFLTKSWLPGDLKAACSARYDELCRKNR